MLVMFAASAAHAAEAASTECGDYEAYKEKLAQSESSGQYFGPCATSKDGRQFCGKYQMGVAEVTAGGFNWEEYKGNAQIQEQAFEAYMQRQIATLRSRGAFDYIGQTINGQVITCGAIIGGAHLGGPGAKGDKGVIGYLDRGTNPSDGNTTISQYVSKFANFALPFCGEENPSCAPSTPPPSVQECDLNYQAAMTEQVNGYQQYMSQMTRQLISPPPSVAQLSCFDYYSKLMSNTVLNRFTGLGSSGIGSFGFTGGSLTDVLSTPFQSFMQGNIAPLLDPNKMLSSITASIGTTLTNAFNVSSALGLGGGTNPALCNAMSAMWNLLQCSGMLNNLPSLNLGSLGQSLMPKGCVSKVLFDTAVQAAKLNMSDMSNFGSNTGFITTIQSGYK